MIDAVTTGEHDVLIVDEASDGVSALERIRRRAQDEQRLSALCRAHAQLESIGRVSLLGSLEAGDVEALAREVTEEAVAICGVARANVWLFDESATVLRCIDHFDAAAGKHTAGAILRQQEFESEFRALKQARYVDADDALNDPRTAGYVEKYLRPAGITSMLDAVVRFSDRHLGLLCLEHVGRVHHWERDEITYACQLADKVALAVTNRARLESQAALRESERRLRESHRIAGMGSWTLDCPEGTIAWSEQLPHILGLPADGPAPSFLELETLFTAESWARMQDAIALAAAGSGRFEVDLEVVRPDGAHRWVTSRGEVVHAKGGVATRMQGTAWDITQRVAYEAALLRAEARLRHTLQQTVGAIGATMDSRDPYTAGHQRRVADMAAAIAREMGLADAVVQGVHFGSLIHDIGKIQIPQELLVKPTRLSRVEFELVKTHATVGYEIVKGIDFPWPVAQIVLQHHERLDGSGYPFGARGDEIALEARIVAVADVVESMASDRPYRPGLGIEAGLAEVEAKRGVAFDAAAVDACLRIFREGRYQL